MKAKSAAFIGNSANRDLIEFLLKELVLDKSKVADLGK